MVTTVATTVVLTTLAGTVVPKTFVVTVGLTSVVKTTNVSINTTALTIRLWFLALCLSVTLLRFVCSPHTHRSGGQTFLYWRGRTNIWRLWWL